MSASEIQRKSADPVLLDGLRKSLPNGAAAFVPADLGYRGALEQVFNRAAAEKKPAMIVQARDAADISAVMQFASTEKLRVAVKGGGHSPFCVADNAIAIDLSAHLNSAEIAADQVVVRGGVTMGNIAFAAATSQRVVPVGMFGTPGMGLALQGGIGALSRNFGLTLDHLVEVELVMPSGDVKTLSAHSTGIDSDLWWALRGAGPNFGVVNRAKFRTHCLSTVRSLRRVTGLVALADVLEWASRASSAVTTSLIVGRDANGDQALLIDAVCSGDPEASDVAETELDEVLRASGTVVSASFSQECDYGNQPPFLFPTNSSSRANADTPVGAFVRCPMVKSSFAAGSLATLLISALSEAPTSKCKVELQQLGGRVAEIGAEETAFWNRSASWSVPITGAWTSAPERVDCQSWVLKTQRSISEATAGYYVVEAVPGNPETIDQVAAAFGGNLPRLAELKRRIDPQEVLSCYYPLSTVD